MVLVSLMRCLIQLKDYMGNQDINKAASIMGRKSAEVRKKTQAPNYYSELAKKRWAKARAKKEQEQSTD